MSLSVKNFEDFPKWLKVIVITIFCLIFYCVGYVLDISSINKQLSVQQKQELELKTQIQALSKNNNKLSDEVALTPVIVNQLKEWQGKLIKSSQLPDLLNDILKVGTANDLRFQLFNPGNELKEGPYLKVPIKAIVIGSYLQIASFVTQIANMSSIVVIGDFIISNEDAPATTIAAKTDNDAPATADKPLKAELTLEVYYLPEK
jgi:type IV pilus assembly protein PilO